MTKTKLPVLLLLLLSACAAVPRGPSVAVMPGPGKSFEQFQADDAACRTYADRSNADVNKIGADNVVTGATVGALIGAAAGALMGGHHGGENGAGVGLLMGTAAGSGNAGGVQHDVQRRYDTSYEQCMYSKGHQLPQAAATTTTYYGHRYRPVTVYESQPQTLIIQQTAPGAAVPPPPGAYPPPPPGANPPPPPPGY